MITNATYKSFSNAMVNAEIGLHVGLYGINVTLKGESALLRREQLSVTHGSPVQNTHTVKPIRRDLDF